MGFRVIGFRAFLKTSFAAEGLAAPEDSWLAGSPRPAPSAEGFRALGFEDFRAFGFRVWCFWVFGVQGFWI